MLQSMASDMLTWVRLDVQQLKHSRKLICIAGGFSVTGAQGAWRQGSAEP